MTTSSVVLFLRRLRRPRLVLITSYAIGTLGLVLIPGALFGSSIDGHVRAYDPETGRIGVSQDYMIQYLEA